MLGNRPNPGKAEAGAGPGPGAATWGARLRGRRVQVGLSLQGLADRAGCSRSYLSMLETGSRGGAVDPGLLARLEGVLGMEPGSLREEAEWAAAPDTLRRRVEELRAEQARQAEVLGRLRALMGADRWLERAAEGVSGGVAAGAERRAGEGAAVLRGGEGGVERGVVERLLPVQVPLINSVAAGYPAGFTDLGYPARVADEYVRTCGVEDPDAFAARVVGDSMSPAYREGDVVVFSPLRPLRNGMDCFVRLERDGESTFKRVELVGAGGETVDGEGAVPTHLRLVPLNPAYPSRLVAREEVAMVCAAVSVTRAV